MTALKNFRVDSFVSGLAIKAPVLVASSAALTLSGEQTVNSRVLVVGDRVLVKDQVDPIENGIYNVETSAWQRAGWQPRYRWRHRGPGLPGIGRRVRLLHHWR